MRLTLLLFRRHSIWQRARPNCSSDLGGAADMSAPAGDLAGAGDMTKIVPYNMPGTVFCYDTTCSTTRPRASARRARAASAPPSPAATSASASNRAVASRHDRVDPRHWGDALPTKVCSRDHAEIVRGLHGSNDLV